MKIANDAWILVADGRKALLLKNAGDEVYPNLKVETVIEDRKNAATREQGTDQPGRVQAGATGRRSAVDQTDWHDAEEARFLAEVADEVEMLRRRHGIERLVVVAPPRALSQLRAAMPDSIRAIVAAELDKDLTRHPVGEIERALVAH
ncbi:host attachment protein [Propylenella binzhouense]|uniref:Host attachment protein n=1 Tax=Propylenella binzhouense TaxID=2555902 RepID=A0A964WTR6_9HYPH|nr:host attachment protein [Propylenella binzhouense]MYZ48322.1 host attachment protein [Propylenella binzhouense]